MKHFLFFLLMISSSLAMAGTQTSTVERFIARSDGLHFLYLKDGSGESANNRAGCAEGHKYWMIKDENSTYGKTQISMILKAHATKEEITVIGTGECTRWHDGEDIGSIIIK